MRFSSFSVIYLWLLRASSLLSVRRPFCQLEENAAMVNALQRHATIIVQKSLAEGFGLTAAEAMWKGERETYGDGAAMFGTGSNDRVPVADAPEVRHARMCIVFWSISGDGVVVALSGRPVIVSAVGGLQDQVEDGRSGLLLSPPSDVARFGELLCQLLTHRDEARAMGEAARKRVRDEFLSTRGISQFVDLMSKILHQSKRQAAGGHEMWPLSLVSRSFNDTTFNNLESLRFEPLYLLNQSLCDRCDLIQLDELRSALAPRLLSLVCARGRAQRLRGETCKFEI
jgi:hypothetical protein